MTTKRNDDIIEVDGKLYQFTRTDDLEQCVGCAFESRPFQFCRDLHCCDCQRIDKLDGRYLAI